MTPEPAARRRALAVVIGIASSAVLLGFYARGAWPLGFVALVPWIVSLDRAPSWRGPWLASIAMTFAFMAAVFPWFAPAISDYTGLPRPAAFVLLLLLGPVLQPQFVAFALMRHVIGTRRGHVLRAALAIAAWLAAEWAVPRVFGDTLGHGLYPAVRLRQWADIAGVGGLTLLLLIVNEAVVMALAATSSARQRAAAALVAGVLPALVAGYGMHRLAALERIEPVARLRVALVQASIVDYEGLARRIGRYAVVRRTLDTHYALSTQAIARAPVDVVVWPETVYPTTFGHPRSADGRALDDELTAFAARSGVGLVFGTYDRDDHGEYNAAAFVDPVRGPIGTYRKTRLFPLTEYVPPALDGPLLRRALPWAGTWRPGDGARVFPLRVRGDREVPVLPLICRDDLDPRLAIDGARLGAQAILGLSNDAWFTRYPLGARLHLTVAAFRSIETRLPQVRATTNGISAVIDATGAIVADTRMGERTVLTGELAIREPPATAVVITGEWLGPLSALVLLCIALAAAWQRFRPNAIAYRDGDAPAPAPAIDGTRTYTVRVLRPWHRILITALQLTARLGVLVLGLSLLGGDEPLRIGLGTMRSFAFFVAAPELLAAVVSWTGAGRLRVRPEGIEIETRRRHVHIPVLQIAALRPWRLPFPSAGLDVMLATGGGWQDGLATPDVASLARRFRVVSPDVPRQSVRERAFAAALALPRARIDHPLLKFVLFPLLPALPAFRLHQHIAYGGTFGEYYSFGAAAYTSALLLWWASWAIGLVLLAGGLRTIVELATAAVVTLQPARAVDLRRALLGFARVVYFVGIPAWLLLRVTTG